MGRITSGVGLVSGIDTGSIVNQLIAIESQPVTILKSQIDQANQQKQAYTDLATGLNGLQTIGNSLALPQTFDAATATSSDPNALTATAAAGAAVGTYQFQVAQLVTTQQSISSGFTDTTTSPVGAGAFTIEQGGGEASSRTSLDQLNGGAGVQRGKFRITDRAGNSAVIDTSTSVNLDDVIKQINNSLNVSVKAALTNQGVVLSDTSGQAKNDLIVQDLAGGSAAAGLGIAGDAGAGSNTITGAKINTVGAQTQLGSLNDGLGVRTAAQGADFRVTAADGTTFDITLGTARTVGDVIAAVNNAGRGKLKAGISAGGASLQIEDTSGGGGTISVAALNGSKAAADLGIAVNATNGSILGGQIIAGLDSVLVSTLNGGKGIPLGQISIADRAGHSAIVDLSAAKSVSDITSAINSAGGGVQISASLNQAGTGIQLKDTSGGGGNVVVADVNSTTAASLGVAGTFNPSTALVVGANLQRQFVNENTALSSLGGGAGVNLGQFTLTNSQGATSTIDLTSGTVSTVGDVINAINAKAVGVRASINANGNGILLTDTAAGANKLTVQDIKGGNAAQGLNLAGTAAGTTIDGGFEKVISITSADTLATVQTKINTLGFGVTANLVNDGSPTNPWRLAITSQKSGKAGRVLLDGGTTNLNPTTLVQAQDAAVLLGGGNGSSGQPLLITGNKNQLTNVIKGVTINLVGTSSSPVTLNIANDPSGVQKNLQDFTDGFNALIDKIGKLTAFNTQTKQGSLLLGEQTPDQITTTLYNAIDTVVRGAGQFKLLADVGITITDGAKLKFDPSKFQSSFASNPGAVKGLFSQAATGLGNVISKAVTTLTDPVSGVITLENNTLDTTIKGFKDRTTELNVLIAAKKLQLQQQFANMESVLAGLQSQQQALGSLSTLATTSATPKTSSSTSTSIA